MWIYSSRNRNAAAVLSTLPPFSYVAKEHGSVAIGAARRALDELIKLATTTVAHFDRQNSTSAKSSIAKSPKPIEAACGARSHA